MSRFKYMYFLFLALFLGVVGCFVSCSDDSGEKKQIVLINSYGKDYIGYGNFEENLKDNFKKAGVAVDIRVLYLDCDAFVEIEEIAQMRRLLDDLDPNKTDLILMINDQAAYSGFKTQHPILKKVPSILVNINYPNEKVLEPYVDDEVYVLRDTPEFKNNIKFIKMLHGDGPVKVVYSIDFTFLGEKSLQNLKKSVDNRAIHAAVERKNLVDGHVYNKLNEMISNLNLEKQINNDSVKLGKDIVVSAAPFRYMDGVSILNVLSITRKDQENNVFLLDKIDVVTRPLPQLLGIPAVTCIREGFNEKLKILGGYFATDELSAKATADLAQKILSGKAANQAKIQDIDKDYVVDWKVLSLYDFFDLKRLPPYVRIVNYPFYERYKYELYALEVIFVIAFIVLVVVLMVVRRRRLAERQSIEILRNMHKKLSRSISGSNIATWRIKDKEVDLDENFVKISGLERQRFEYKEFLRYIYVDDISLIRDIIEQVRATNEMLIQRVRLCFSNHNYVWYEVRCSSFANKNGEIIVAGIIQDIQNVVDREQELIKAKELAEKAELKQSFLTNMSHEIRTPLNAIVGFTNILMNEDASSLSKSDREEMITLVNSNSELLLKLINDVLDISRLDSNSLEFKMEKCDLVPLLKEIYNTHKVIINQALDFKFIVDESVPIMVSIDKMRFTQVISNLLSNANKFTESGGIILACEVDLKRKKVITYVEDSGKGIDADHLNAIFDRFYKTDEFAQGTGLGLSICKVIMERLSGDITVQSKPGEGSCFIVSLPLI